MVRHCIVFSLQLLKEKWKIRLMFLTNYPDCWVESEHQRAKWRQETPEKRHRLQSGEGQGGLDQA